VCTLLQTVHYTNTDPTSPDYQYRGNNEIIVKMQDTGSGLQSITLTGLNNATLSPYETTPSDHVGNILNNPVIPNGYTGEIDEGAVKKINTAGSTVSYQVKDVAGNVTSCDPLLTSVIRGNGVPSSDSVSGIAQADHLLHVYNQTPGIETLTVGVNGQTFSLRGLASGQTAVLDIAAALRPGDNTVNVLTTGKPGGSADLLFGNI
jgi:hypothetical protein